MTARASVYHENKKNLEKYRHSIFISTIIFKKAFAKLTR